MRVALFFDGKNFYSGWKDSASGQTIDFVKLSRWLVERVGGSFLWGAYYYTGIEPGADPATPNRLAPFLEMLELRPGFLVQRFPRKKRSKRCDACGVENHYTEEKEVDTTMVADMLRLAAVGAFDILVLLSGDADHSPAVEGVRMLGKQAYVATWGKEGLSSRLRKAAFDHIDLRVWRSRRTAMRSSSVAFIDGQNGRTRRWRLAPERFTSRPPGSASASRAPMLMLMPTLDHDPAPAPNFLQTREQ